MRKNDHLITLHMSRIQYLQALKIAPTYGIILLHLLEHKTNRLQPLDIGVSGPVQF